MELHELGIARAGKLLAERRISSLELTSALIERIEKHDDKLGAFLSVYKEKALGQARKADKDIAAGNFTPMTGIPVALKDLLCVNGMKTTCASKILENFIPRYDAHVVKKLNQAGAVIMGKTNMDEFAMGSSTENSAFKLTRNPWNPDHVPGGSSGGSAAAVAAGFCCAALGSDTGGSIRQPASHCGIVGLKPTYGRVSRFGLVSYASSLDQIGPMAGSVEDTAILLNTIAGHDKMDSTSAEKPVPDFTQAFEIFEKQGLKGMTAGIPEEYLAIEGLDPEVEKIFKDACRVLEDMGVKIRQISLPNTKYVVAAYYIIAPCEASSNLARFDGVKYGMRKADCEDMMDLYKKTRSEGFGSEVQRRILIGTFALSSGYYDARRGWVYNVHET